MKKSKVLIFICTFDYFKKGYPIYTFEQRCKEDTSIVLGDDTRRIFVNPYGANSSSSEDVKAFLEYIQNGVPTDNFTLELDNSVYDAREHKQWEVEYMEWRAYEMDMNYDKKLAREEGLAEGRAEGQTQLALAIKYLKDNKDDQEILSLGIDTDTLQLAKTLI